MGNIITIKHVRAFVDENGTAQLNLEDAARGLGLTKIAPLTKQLVQQFASPVIDASDDF